MKPFYRTCSNFAFNNLNTSPSGFVIHLESDVSMLNRVKMQTNNRPFLQYCNVNHLCNCVRAKRERILIMSISNLYIERHRKNSMPGSFGRKPLFRVIASQFKVAKAWYGWAKGRHPARDRNSMPSHFRVFRKEASLSCYCRAKGQYRKINCSNFQTFNHLERKPGFYFLFGYFIQSILNKTEMLRTQLPNLWLLLVL